VHNEEKQNMIPNAKWQLPVNHYMVMLITELSPFCSEQEIVICEKVYEKLDKNVELMSPTQSELSKDLLLLSCEGFAGIQKVKFTSYGLQLILKNLLPERENNFPKTRILLDQVVYNRCDDLVIDLQIEEK
jgi:hypothetical protein